MHTPRSLPPWVASIPPQDCDLLFRAVTQKLQASGQQIPTPHARDLFDECMKSLGMLHAAQHVQLQHLRKLEGQLQATQAALTKAQAELSATRASERDAQDLSMQDSLTNLPNRRHFYRRANDALGMGMSGGSSPALAVLFVDLDDFKPVNDVHGHLVGDLLLRGVAQRLRDSVDEIDVVCRLGGDEFACLMPRLLNRDELIQLASRMTASIASPLLVGQLEFHVHASIGIAVFPADGQTTTSLLERADSAMYRAKSQHLGYAFAGD